MKKLFLALLLLTAGCRTVQNTDGFELKANGNSVGQFMGLEAVSKTIAARMLKVGFSQQNFSLRRYLPGNNFGFGTGDLGELLGQYTVVNGNGEFKNGTPNAMNMALWHLVMGRLATDLAMQCRPEMATPPPEQPLTPVVISLRLAELTNPLVVGTQGAPVDEAYQKKLKALCTWPAEDAKKEETMLALWTATMGFQAPKAVFKAWREHFTSDAAYQGTGAAASEASVRELMLGIFMQPHFLLSK